MIKADPVYARRRDLSWTDAIPASEPPSVVERCGFCQHTTEFVDDHCGRCGLNAAQDTVAEAAEKRRRRREWFDAQGVLCSVEAAE